MDHGYEEFTTSGVPIRAWVRGVEIDPGARRQLENVARLPFIHKWVAAMPDVHWGIGATVGSVIPARKAIVPAAVGVDIGCGMMAAKTTLTASDLPENLRQLRAGIERAVPHGRTHRGGRNDRGTWGSPPNRVGRTWRKLERDYAEIIAKHPRLEHDGSTRQLGTLGSGNHFIELCLDEDQHVWVMLHSGSRGVGNRIGTHFIAAARKAMESEISRLPDRDLAYFQEGTPLFDDYVQAVGWAQRYARENRELMMSAVLEVLRTSKELPSFQVDGVTVNCHHNYVQRELHFGEEVWLTRKGAVSAREGELGIIPGSMGAKSFIVRGKGNVDSFHSCSHGAGRLLSRTAAKKRFTLEDHALATEGVECRKDDGVLDETPGAYKPIDAVMQAQKDLVDVVATLKQVVCVKG